MSHDTAPHIDAKRLVEALTRLGLHGKIAPRGVCSLALDPTNIEARIEVLEAMEALGLRIWIDPIGNLFGVRPDKNGRTDAEIVMSGSHIDTVPTGGLYDGRLGVLGPLEIFRVLDDAGIKTDRPLGVAVFTAEEGARYQPAMIGSRVFCGLMTLQEALDITPHIPGDTLRLGDGLEAFRDALVRAHATDVLNDDYTDWTVFPISSVAAFTEWHIEQGPALEDAKLSVAPVKAVLGISQRLLELRCDWPEEVAFAAFELARRARGVARAMGGEQRATVGVIEAIGTRTLDAGAQAVKITIRGEATHAGGGIMPRRRDAAYAASVLVDRARRHCRSLADACHLSVADLSIGLLRQEGIKGTINVVPEAAELTLVLGGGTEEEFSGLRFVLENTAAELSADVGSYGERAGSHPGEGVTIGFETAAGPFEMPESVRVSLDLRNGEDALIEDSDIRMDAQIQEVATIFRAEITSRRKQRIAPVGFHAGVRAAMTRAETSLGFPDDLEVVLAAGHDCCNVAFTAPETVSGVRTRIPCAMLAVQSVGGISHNIEELTHAEDLQRAGDVLLRALLALSRGEADGAWQSPPPTVHTQELEKRWNGRQ